MLPLTAYKLPTSMDCGSNIAISTASGFATRRNCMRKPTMLEKAEDCVSWFTCRTAWSTRSAAFPIMRAQRQEHTRNNSDCRGNLVPLSAVLHCINPKGHKTIPLNDPVPPTQHSLLKSVPLPCRPRVQEVCETYIYKHHSFQIPVEVFTRMYQETKGSNKPSPQRPRPKAPVLQSALRKRLKSLSQERLFITYDASFKILVGKKLTQSPSPTSPRKSHKRRLSDSVESTPSDGSYADMYSRKERLRRVCEWADIRTAQAVAVNKTRINSPWKNRFSHGRSASAEEGLGSHRSYC